MISGTIDIEICEKFESKELTVALVGAERSHFDVPIPKGGEPDIKEFHREYKEIIHMRQVIAEYEPGKSLEKGQYTFPFQVHLPEWLPESTVFKTETQKFFTEYTIRA